MKFSNLASKTLKEVNQEDISKNAQFLLRAGFIDKLQAGVFTFLPLGLRVLNKIENIVREEMNKVDSNEVLMPALQPADIWHKTGRWDQIDVMFKLKGAGDRDLALGATHEEVVTPLAQTFIKSYKDLPVSVYQVQTKFRNEARAKSGLLRGREFRMKDMYSFHADADCMDAYYDRATEAYHNVYERLGIGEKTYFTFADGGAFSKYSHEYQTACESGEDIIYLIPGTKQAINKEIIEDKEALAEIIPNYVDGMENDFETVKAIEVGNTFKLGTKFSDAFGLSVQTEQGNTNLLMGCYGIGPSRVMGTIVELLADDKGLVWPENIAPYKVHLISLVKGDDKVAVDELYNKLVAAGVEVLYDDRESGGAGAKMADADLMGIPHRVVVGKRTLAEGKAEYKARTSDEAELFDFDAIVEKLK